MSRQSMSAWFAGDMGSMRTTWPNSECLRLLYHVTDKWESGTAGYDDVLDLVKPIHVEDSSLAAHMEGLQTIEVDLVDRSRLRSISKSCKGVTLQLWRGGTDSKH